MSIEIYEVHFANEIRNHEVIESYKWRNADNSGSITDKPTMVQWIDEGGKAFVGQGQNSVEVFAAHPTDGRRPFCQTISDGQWSNNLLSLPIF